MSGGEEKRLAGVDDGWRRLVGGAGGAAGDDGAAGEDGVAGGAGRDGVAGGLAWLAEEWRTADRERDGIGLK
ncbi:unnamed protein product [Cuscuta campestris]|uniref:Uncharacterized protein n=1 Tax=Cuscuta campestris TaxID=132261 RepID=A0A484L0M5_9ASTE|nr:unnamed protein product [Cuscuta campestris]